MKREAVKGLFTCAFLFCAFCGRGLAQFRDDFNGPLKKDPEGALGWAYFAGEGKVAMDFRQGEGYASILVDATKDTRNVWWALIKRRVSDGLDLGKLKDPKYALRIQARIRVSEAPRRVNLSLNTQRTVDFHTNLMEYDIPDTTGWHTISLTLRGFDARPGDTVNAQMALMDWGLGQYRVDVDEFRADVVETDRAGPDLGDPIPYHPPVADPRSFAVALPVTQDAIIDLDNPGVNFRNWRLGPRPDSRNVLTVSGRQVAILRWDFASFKGGKVRGSGLLEVTTRLIGRIVDTIPDFGEVRAVEIIGGDPRWDRATVTTDNLLRGAALDRVLLPQMIIDWPAAEEDGAATLFTIPRVVLQRLIDGKSLGLALRALGALDASFYSSVDSDGRHAARLLFSLE